MLFKGLCTFGFLVFSGDIKWEHLPEMGYSLFPTAWLVVHYFQQRDWLFIISNSVIGCSLFPTAWLFVPYFQQRDWLFIISNSVIGCSLFPTAWLVIHYFQQRDWFRSSVKTIILLETVISTETYYENKKQKLSNNFKLQYCHIIIIFSTISSSEAIIENFWLQNFFKFLFTKQQKYYESLL